MLVWDAEGSPPVGDWTTVLWSDYPKANEPGVTSIPVLVEEQADALRARYLAWIYELGETRIKGKRLIDHLELRSGFSYWWMTLIAQKFNVSGKSNTNDAIKLFVLEELINDFAIHSITVISANRCIAEVLENYCKKTNTNFQFKYSKKNNKSIGIFRKVYRSLPYCIQAIIFLLRYLKNAFPLLIKKKKTSSVPYADISFIDVLVHLDKRAFTSGAFVSNYWTCLVDCLANAGVMTNWLHNYFKYKDISSPAQAEHLITRFNKCECQVHCLIESNLTITVFKRALIDFYKLNKTKFELSKISQSFSAAGSTLDLWPLFKKEWNESLCGPGAMMDCLRLSLYEKTLSSIPRQQLGVYIQENQHWEMALIYTWKAAGHGKLIGVPHTTVRYWDLRYFYDPRSYERSGNNVLPIPDLVAVNGPIAKRTYLNGGYPESQVVEVEALRFLNLLKFAPVNTDIKHSRKGLNVLICGDFLSSTNYKMLTWLTIAAQSLPPEASYIFKPHPAYPVKLSDFKSLTIEMADAPLAGLFADCDVVFTSNITSAAVDAYCAGIPVVQMLDGNAFNMSPLRDLKGVVYVTNPIELAEALRNARYRESLVVEPYFYLDEGLPRWRQLLGLSPMYAN